MKAKPATEADYANAQFEAALNAEQVQSIEEAAQNAAVNRRLMLSMLARSKTEMMTATGEALLDAHDAVVNYSNHLRAQLEMCEAAKVRLLSASTTVHVKSR